MRGAWRGSWVRRRLSRAVDSARRAGKAAGEAWNERRSNRSWNRPERLPALSLARRRSDSEVRADLERLLLENVLPFWTSQTIDPGGGFHQNHDARGRSRGPAPKHIVGQARQTWFFAKLAQSPYGTTTHLDIARHGFEFLRDCLWDPEHGGFFWEVTADGRRPSMPGKHLYGQAFGLYALSEYALASKDPAATALADEAFLVLEARARDHEHGGYREFFERDWSMPAPGTLDCRHRLDARVKTFDTHLHLLEALTVYGRLVADAGAHRRLGELVTVLTIATARPVRGPKVDQHAPDWTPAAGRALSRVNYGHDVENAWLLAEAFGVLGWPLPLLVAFNRAALVHTLSYGFDRRGGGLFLMGCAGVPADLRQKVWWVQAEALVATLLMSQLDHTLPYRDYFERILDWVIGYQADWINGDWHAAVDSAGRPSGMKAEAFKTPYHHGRALLKCLELTRGAPGAHPR